MQKICVLGLGYIGLPTASMFATHDFQVVGVDTNCKVVETLNNGDVHIKEPGLKTIVQAAIKSGNLKVKGEVETADVFIIAVPTPVTKDRRPDLSCIRSATESIVPHLHGGNLVILESTVPPRTTLAVMKPILERSGLGAGIDFYLAHSPERVLPTRILIELIENDRVIGGIDEASAELARDLYKSFVRGDIHLTDITTAEMVKLMENTYRDVNIALANEFALIADKIGINIWEAIEMADRHPRVNIHRPGPGVGGHCIAVDPWFLVECAPEVARLIRLSREINDGMPSYVVRVVRKELCGIPAPIVTVFGIAYKGNVDDIRESPALEVVDELLEAGYAVRIFDPHVQELPRLSAYLFALDDAVEGSDCLLVLTDHTEFKDILPQKIASAMRNKILIDTRDCLEHSDWRREGFRVVLLGKGGEKSSDQGFIRLRYAARGHQDGPSHSGIEQAS